MDQALFTAGELQEATGGCWQNMPPESLQWQINTDSRTLQGAQCFIPLIGERFDGHDFLDQLPENTIALAQLGRKIPAHLPVLQVSDTLKAYQDIARYHRLRMKNLQIAAVTGSIGKTSVKEMLRAIFTEAAGADAVLYTIGNTNNQIGVPQNLLRLNRNIRYAVIEMGTNHHGEIAPLSRTALPDAAVINTIAPCHLEHLGDLDGVAREKSAVFTKLAPDGTAVYPAECAGNAIIKKAAAAFRNLTFGSSPDAAVSGKYISGSLNGSRVRLHFRQLDISKEFDWELTGTHQAANAAAAAAAALALQIDPEVIARGLSKTTLPGKRMNSVQYGSCTWINDAYNANPQSMQSSLNCIADNTPYEKPLLLILGDMLELGSDETAYHRQVLEQLQSRFKKHKYRLFLLGKRFAEALQSYPDLPENWQTFDDMEQLQTALKNVSLDNLTVFLKSSNSIGLSKVEPC
ncbi:MAG: UDP-N-acetylmuramoyl-tripeptide--D-alanyl-D-alanine ligase [Lentisphaerae bacterium]|nr:UDP-N-acetylmuramoyl-tripeptide--D-alanyl-D-alanine ligase [Lentisphaerota bacterium]